ncbi:hypothetical protein CEXT_326371 [Caerostris extrusa]|uniref:Uncharacterized protein n=1 Tax=Caerostris extrusa TaxID=172846 RepID=A0AAV4MWY8_CAEEX|nr:hypothetical protein CEXT_326371 [Caerostris extrusa]
MYHVIALQVKPSISDDSMPLAAGDALAPLAAGPDADPRDHSDGFIQATPSQQSAISRERSLSGLPSNCGALLVSLYCVRPSLSRNYWRHLGSSHYGLTI